jgi:hypothetical protein
MERKGVSKVFDTFEKGRKIGCLLTSTDLNLYLIEESSPSLGRLFCTAPLLYKR